MVCIFVTYKSLGFTWDGRNCDGYGFAGQIYETIGRDLERIIGMAF